MRLITLVLAAGIVGSAAPRHALQLAPPPGWKWVTDRPAQLSTVPDRQGDTLFTFVRMPPGFHITMGPGGVLYEPRFIAEQRFTLESEIFHFPNSTNGEYGLFVGGTGLEGSSPRYVSFVLRGDGSVAAWERSAAGTRMLSEWRRADAVIPADGKEAQRNRLRLVVTRQEAVLKANGLDILILPLEGLSLDGNFGFRVGEGLNLHVTTLDVTQRLAPARGQ